MEKVPSAPVCVLFCAFAPNGTGVGFNLGLPGGVNEVGLESFGDGAKGCDFSTEGRFSTQESVHAHP